MTSEQLRYVVWESFKKIIHSWLTQLIYNGLSKNFTSNSEIIALINFPDGCSIITPPPLKKQRTKLNERLTGNIWRHCVKNMFNFAGLIQTLFLNYILRVNLKASVTHFYLLPNISNCLVLKTTKINFLKSLMFTQYFYFSKTSSGFTSTLWFVCKSLSITIK